VQKLRYDYWRSVLENRVLTRSLGLRGIKGQEGRENFIVKTFVSCIP